MMSPAPAALIQPRVQRGSRVSLFFAVFLLLSLVAFLTFLFSNRCPQPYMDEVFHLNQTREYCKGNYDKWDPKITTFPGMYFTGLFYAKNIEVISRFLAPSIPVDGCTLPYLRSMNALFNLGSFMVLYTIFRNKQYAREDAILHAMTVVLYPVSFFVGFLYYTDAGALYLVLVMYTLARRGKHKWAAFAGLISVLFRQTNVVWVAYILGTCMVDDLASLVGKKETGIATTEFFSRHLLYRFVISVFKERHLLLSHLWPYLVPLSSFVAFLIWNGGSVVVGDKKHHAPVFHFAQLAYFFSIAALTSNSELLMTRRSVTPFWAWVMRQGLVKLVLLLGTAAYLLHYYTLDHPFLLADNRHYTFYIWKRFFQRIPHLNLLLLPFYVFWTWLVLSRIRQATSALSATIFFVAVSLVLLPAQLLEPRYYNIPLTIVLLETPRRSWISLAFSIMCMLVVNAVTIYVFLYRPFTWVDGTTARFMW